MCEKNKNKKRKVFDLKKQRIVSNEMAQFVAQADRTDKQYQKKARKVCAGEEGGGGGWGGYCFMWTCVGEGRRSCRSVHFFPVNSKLNSFLLVYCLPPPPFPPPFPFPFPSHLQGNWRQKHEDFIAAIRAAKGGDSAHPAPPAANLDYVTVRVP